MYSIQDTAIVKRTPTGTIMPTVVVSMAGTKIKRISIRVIGAIAIFQFLEMNTTPNAPKSAGRSWSKAGWKPG